MTADNRNMLHILCQLLMTKVTSLCLSGGILIVGGKPPTLDISISGPAVGTAG